MAEHTEVLSSFRDPAGRTFQCERRIFRVIGKQGSDLLTLVGTSQTLQRFINSGNFVVTQELNNAQARELERFPELRRFAQSTADPLLVEHDAVPFPSFPYEWAPEMLYAAGTLTLDLCESLLQEGIGLKDATPYNVLYRGVQPIFVDLLSIEKRRSDDPIWLPYAQFLRMFLLPLLAVRRWRTPLAEIFLTHRDGLHPAELYQRVGLFERFDPSVLRLVSMPTWLEGSQSRNASSLYRPHTASSDEHARFILRRTFRRLRRMLIALKPVPQQSAWSEYASDNSYSALQAGQKHAFVVSAMQKFCPKRVLDIGCNSGDFSLLAAHHGADVVAIDSDQASAGAVFRRASEHKLPVLPLVVDIGRPTPAVGFNNSEHRSFLSRAAGTFDAVFMLAVVHHLLITERIPLPSIVDLGANLTTDLLVIEYVGQQDPMFQTLVRGRQALHEGFTRELFEQECKRRFQLIESTQVQPERWLYILRKLP